jgi:tape measure domain-containing protein
MADIPVRVIIEAIDKASQKFEDVATSMGTMGKQATWGANALATLGVASIGLGIQVVKTAGEFEQQEKALSVMLGSAEKGAELFNRLKEEAKTTPFQLTDVVEASKQLMAMGTSVEDVIPQMRMLGDVSAGLGVPLERLIINFGQVQTQGKLTGRELRDFAISGVPMFDELAKVMGVSKDAISDLVSEGKVGFPEVVKAFENMTSAGGKFNNLMQEQSKTTLGKFSNIKDAVSILSAEMGKALLPVVNQTFDALTPMIVKFGEFTAANPKLVTSLLGVGVGLGSLGIALKALGPAMKAVVGIFTLGKGAVMIAV